MFVERRLDMPTKKNILSIVLDDPTFKALNDFRFNNRISTQSKAGMIILRAGMEALKNEYPELDVSTKLETGKKEKQNVVTSV